MSLEPPYLEARLAKSDRAELVAARVRPSLQKASKTQRIVLSRFRIDRPLHAGYPANSTRAELAGPRHESSVWAAATYEYHLRKKILQKSWPHRFKNIEKSRSLFSTPIGAIGDAVPHPGVVGTGRHTFNRVWVPDAGTCAWWAQLAKVPAGFFRLTALTVEKSRLHSSGQARG